MIEEQKLRKFHVVDPASETVEERQKKKRKKKTKKKKESSRNMLRRRHDNKNNNNVVVPSTNKMSLSSSETLPRLASYTKERLQNNEMEFPINGECTSLALVPSGRHVVAGFTDGTLRLFDTTGLHTQSPSSEQQQQEKMDDFCTNLFDSESSDADQDDDDDDAATRSSVSTKSTTTTTSSSSSRKSALVCSKSHQRYGTVACQIHAKGVHTSLQMHVDTSPDGRFCFGGVARGSMELVAVDLTDLELHHDEQSSQQHLLDLVRVHRHSDAKLRGFGACTVLRPSNTPTYLLLTGRGIKNIHIWSFVPSKDQWQCLYDTQTNGNSISLLHFRYKQPQPNGPPQLQALSKSDNQKVRVWDLSLEQQQTVSNRPKRPPFHDIVATESVLGIGGDFCFGGNYHHRVTLLHLDVNSPVHTELALPGGGGGRGRRQRGELKSIVHIAGLKADASHALIQLSDGSLVQYSQGSNREPRLETLPSTLLPTDPEQTKALSLARIGAEGITVAAVATSANGKGSIVLRQIAGPSSEGSWGYHGVAASALDSVIPVSVPAMTTTQSTPHKPHRILDSAVKQPKMCSPLNHTPPIGVAVSPDQLITTPPPAPRPKDGAMLKFLSKHTTGAAAPPKASRKRNQPKSSTGRPSLTAKKQKMDGSPATPKHSGPQPSTPEQPSTLVQKQTPPKGSDRQETQSDETKTSNDLPAVTSPEAVKPHPNPFSSLLSVGKSVFDGLTEPEAGRVRLILSHRAAHQSLRRKVLESADLVMMTATEDAKGWLEDAIGRHQEALECMLSTQRLEAGAFHSLHYDLPPIAVSFPFPQVFDQARQRLQKHKNRPQR